MGLIYSSCPASVMGEEVCEWHGRECRGGVEDTYALAAREPGQDHVLGVAGPGDHEGAVPGDELRKEGVRNTSTVVAGGKRR